MRDKDPVPRRRFLLEQFGLLGQYVVKAVEDALVSAGTGRKRYLRPPGALPEAQFLLTCERCGKCAEACTRGAIVYLDEKAGAAFGTPYIDPESMPCYLEMKCMEVCPSGVLQVLTDPRQVRMGTARLDTNTCWNYQGQFCEICYDKCPFPDEAIRLDDSRRPYIVADACVGCGICAHLCPTTPSSIQIEVTRP